MRNITLIIASHNKSILRPKSKEYCCNSRNKESCSLQNRCLTPKVIYKNTVTNNGDDEKRIYLSNSDTIFKEQYRNYTRDFNKESYANCTGLSKYIWQ